MYKIKNKKDMLSTKLYSWFHTNIKMTKKTSKPLYLNHVHQLPQIEANKCCRVHDLVLAQALFATWIDFTPYPILFQVMHNEIDPLILEYSNVKKTFKKIKNKQTKNPKTILTIT